MIESPTRHIVALGGGGFSEEPDNPLLDDFILNLTGEPRPRVCFLPTASGNAAGYVQRFYDAFPAGRAQATHLPLFRRTEPDLRTFMFGQDVIYVGGGNAGALCWFGGGTTDSLGNGLSPLRDGLDLLRGSFCPHYDSEPERRPTYQSAVLGGLPSGYAGDDGAGLHFVGTELREAVNSRPGARVYRVERQGWRAVEAPVATRFLG